MQNLQKKLNRLVGKKNKKAKTLATAIVINETPATSKGTETLKETVHLRVDKKDLQVSNESIDRVRKGMINQWNNCFANVVFQCMLGCAPFYNFVNSISQKVLEENDREGSTVAAFAELAK